MDAITNKVMGVKLDDQSAVSGEAKTEDVGSDPTAGPSSSEGTGSSSQQEALDLSESTLDTTLLADDVATYI